jgi:hypothetical protein
MLRPPLCPPLKIGFHARNRTPALAFKSILPKADARAKIGPAVFTLEQVSQSP